MASAVEPGRQTTLGGSTGWIAGMHLDRDAPARVRFHPGAAGSGVVFVRGDEGGGPEVRCVPENLQSMPRWTSLCEGGHWVHHTEHVLAAVALCGLDNVRVEMDADRLPMVGGGSCAEFVAALQGAGTRKQEAVRQVYALREPVRYLDAENTAGETLAVPSLRNGRYVVGVPAEGFSVAAVFHWAHMPGLPVGVAEYEEGDEAGGAELAGARSYLVETELEQVRELLGPVREQVMRLAPGCPAERGQEAARHKIVDFLGDLRVLGRPVRGCFLAFRAGHRIHHELVRRLVAENRLELVEDA